MSDGDEARAGAAGLDRGPWVMAEAVDSLRFVVDLAFDTAKNIALLAGLSVIFFAAESLKRVGMDASDVHLIQRLHFWLTFAGLAWIGIVFLAKLIWRSLQ